MTEEKTNQTERKRIKAKPLPVTEGINAKKVETSAEEKTNVKPAENVANENSKPAHPKKEEKKKSEPQKITKKDEAIANGQSLNVSKKQCMYICRFIKNKPIVKAIEDLEKVIKYKIAVPFRGEIPHRKGRGIMSGRYPIKASKLFIKLLKGLKGNVIVNQMELERTRIVIASASFARRPMRRDGVKGKRANVILKAREVKEEKK